MNDITTINWKRLARALPRAKSYSSNDRAPTLEEIRKLVEYPDRRIKPIVYAMASGGFRLGAWDYLHWKHVTPITTNNEKDSELLAAKVLIYAGEPEEYYTFITPEAYNALKDWMDFRALHGEKTTGESWVMRNTWRTADVKRWQRSGASGLATYPKKLQSAAIKKILSRALFEQGIRDSPLPEGVKRYEWKGAHGYRKFYKSRAEQVMKPINVELTMGHALGLSESYYKPTEREVLEDYLKAVDLLTINDKKLTLQKQVVELTEKSKEENYLIKGKLAEKEREAEQTKIELEVMKARQVAFEERTSKQVEKMTQVIAELIARESDINRDDPEDIKNLDRDVNRAINHSVNYFGEDDFLKRKSPVVHLEEEVEAIAVAARKQQQDIEQFKAEIKTQLEKNNAAANQLDILLQALLKLQKQETNAGTATTQAPKDFVLRKLGILTKGKIGEDPETGIIDERLSPEESGSSRRC